MQSDKLLVEKCKKGHREAQRQLYDRFSGAMLVVASRYTRSQQEAEDVLQEAFIKIFKHIKTFKGSSTLACWIKRIVVNAALNSQRGKLYMFPMVDAKEIEDDVTEDFTLSQYHFTELLALIRELPAGCQSIFNLFAIEGYNHREIADMLGISVGTSKSQYSRARKLLRDKIVNEERISHEQAK